MAKYRAVFANLLYVKDNATGQYFPFPDIDVNAFTSVKLEHDIWLLRRDVTAGYVFAVRVARSGEWAAIEEADFLQM